MTRKGLGVTLLIVVSTAALVVWIANRTSWEEVKLPMPPKGEARVNPHYAAQRFAEALGATTTWDRVLAVPGTDAVLVLSNWRWSLDRSRRLALERWVDAGGRLVVDDRLIDPLGEFEKWSGIVWQFPDSDPDAPDDQKVKEEDALCRRVQEEFDGRPSSATGDSTLWLCDLGSTWLESERPPRWVLRDKKGIQAIRVSIGRGSVTAINASPFRARALFDGDHGPVFVAATGLRRGDEIHFVSNDGYPSLLALTWHYGAPAVALGVMLLAALLWRGAVRIGPLAPPVVAARRSLADQIRGSGRFALRHGGGLALHAASLRALEEAARRRISRYALLIPDERSAALARATGFDRDSLAAAIHDPRRRTAGELHRTIALLEAARRHILMRQTRSDHDRR